MKTYERVIHSYERDVLRERKCDLCGALSKNEITHDWSGACYEINETEVTVTIKHKKGENYPEGGSGTECEVDLCPNCFKNKLIPWLNSQGANIKEKEWNW